MYATIPAPFLNVGPYHAAVWKSSGDIRRCSYTRNYSEVGELISEASEANPGATKLSDNQELDCVNHPRLERDGQSCTRAVRSAGIFFPARNSVCSARAGVAQRYLIDLRGDKRCVGGPYYRPMYDRS